MNSHQHSQAIFADNGALVASGAGRRAALKVAPITTATPAGRLAGDPVTVAPRLYLVSHPAGQPDRAITIEPARPAARVAAEAQDRARAAARHPSGKLINPGPADAGGTLLRFPASTAAPAAAPASARPSGEHCRTCTASDEHDQWNAAARGETPMQRLDRAYAEILQEVRVAQTGVQILLAFLLTLAFTARFASITHLQRDIYVTTLMLAASATALLIAPAAFHRVVYRKRLKQQLVRIANRLALAGLLLLLTALGSALLLIFDVVLGMHPAVFLTAGTLTWFATWWFILPAWTRIRHGNCAQPPATAEA